MPLPATREARTPCCRHRILPRGLPCGPPPRDLEARAALRAAAARTRQWSLPSQPRSPPAEPRVPVSPQRREASRGRRRTAPLPSPPQRGCGGTTSPRAPPQAATSPRWPSFVPSPPRTISYEALYAQIRFMTDQIYVDIGDGLYGTMYDVL
ncbi:hypothetical protein U9M48_002842 [Paspalum notatum var. saurae]|uniref:Uncharacterized protein n=1 Tax=Paspalum notatum var. saurae TaxID=547442 RepID=A0AAQ3PRT5_PASNO